MIAPPDTEMYLCTDRPYEVERRGIQMRKVIGCGPVRRLRTVGREFNARLLHAAVADEGMSTVEYAIGTIAAAAFGAVLYTVVTGESIPDALTGIIEKALNTSV